MKFTQQVSYQNIDGSGRDCLERWDKIKTYFLEDPYSLSIDIGSAEGYFCREIVNTTKGRIISVEASDLMIKRQQKYCSEEISNGTISLLTDPLLSDSLDRFTLASYDYCLLLSVLHWVDEPDVFLSKFAACSKLLFIELPELDDQLAWNQDYLARIRSDYRTLERYIEIITGKKIEKFYVVSAHSSPTRRLFVVK